MPGSILKNRPMIKKILYLLFIVFLLPTFSFSLHIENDSIIPEPPSLKPYKVKSKVLSGIKEDTFSFNFPLITLHLGGSLGFSNGNARFNTENAPGTNVNFNKDLGFPSSFVFPRFNAVFAFARKAQFIFDLNAIHIKKTGHVDKAVRVGNLDLPGGTSIKNDFKLFFVNGAYRNSFITKRHFDVGLLVGLDLHQYTLKLRNNETGERDKTSFSIWAPIIGLDWYGFVHKDLFFRTTAYVSAFPFHNYDFTEFAFKSYIEYFFIKNVGMGVSYNYFYSDIRQYSKINGSLKYQIHAFSLFASLRIP
jgi:hypothetical protein